ncbi:unnamed protein product [Didymodactylos carnosus]|uniref:Uncharacterized protein n=1 Tax=Didymodactylos carnosus TaxID=1234261 RepID=A0A814TMK3_9BILA|nr:unnamed protein product [Didymodactylos carnosus]CAF3923656.1 unnamed protein product [Didymodactylos carnosus]
MHWQKPSSCSESACWVTHCPLSGSLDADKKNPKSHDHLYVDENTLDYDNTKRTSTPKRTPARRIPPTRIPTENGHDGFTDGFSVDEESEFHEAVDPIFLTRRRQKQGLIEELLFLGMMGFGSLEDSVQVKGSRFYDSTDEPAHDQVTNQQAQLSQETRKTSRFMLFRRR